MAREKILRIRAVLGNTEKTQARIYEDADKAAEELISLQGVPYNHNQAHAGILHAIKHGVEFPRGESRHRYTWDFLLEPKDNGASNG